MPTRLGGRGTEGGTEVEVVVTLLLLLEEDAAAADDDDDDEVAEVDDDDEVAFLRTAMFLTFSNASRNAFCTATAL